MEDSSTEEKSRPAIRRQRTSLNPAQREKLKRDLEPLYKETSATDICFALALLMEEEGNLVGSRRLREFVLPLDTAKPSTSTSVSGS